MLVALSAQRKGRFVHTTRCLVLSFLVLLAAAGASADSISVSANGTWGAGAAMSSWSAPGDTWSFSFTVANPTPATALGSTDEVLPGDIMNFSFMLNGAPVNETLEDILFVPSIPGGVFNGGLELDFASGSDTTNMATCSTINPCMINTFGDQLYTGAPPTITLTKGSPSVTGIDVDFTGSNGMININTNGTGSVNSFAVGSPNAVPEPATMWLVGMGGLGLLAKRRKKTAER